MLISGMALIGLGTSYLAIAGPGEHVQSNFTKAIAFVFINILAGVILTVEMALTFRIRERGKNLSRHVRTKNQFIL